MKLSTYVRRSAIIIFFIIPVVLLVGCLISEYDEYRIKLNADGKSGTISIINRNVQSDQIDPLKQQEDFNNLLRDWKSDSYLLEKTKDGVYVKERKLFQERHVLVWKEVAIFSDFHQLFRDVIVGDRIRIGFGKEETITATNGELIRTKDSTIVHWPQATKEFVLKVQRNNFKPASDFAAKFKAYTRKSTRK